MALAVAAIGLGAGLLVVVVPSATHGTTTNPRPGVPVINVRTTIIGVGGGPVAVATNPEGTYAYVSNNGANSVSVIDLARRVVTATIRVGQSPGGLAVSPDGAFVYVTSERANFLSVIDTTTNEIVKRVNLDSPSEDVAFGPGGRYAYVTDYSAVSIISTSSQEVLGTVPVAPGAFDIAMSPDGRALYGNTEYGGTAGESFGSSLQVISTTTRKVETMIEEKGLAPFGLAVNPNGSGVYESFAGGEAVTDVGVRVLSTATNRVTGTVRIAGGARGIAFTPDGKWAYICTANGQLAIVDTATTTVVASVNLGGVRLGEDPWAVAITPDAEHAYVANFDFLDRHNGSVTVLDLPRS